MDQLREFLSRALPWPDEGQAHYCNVHWKSDGYNGKPYWDGRACRTVDDAIRTIKWVGGLSNARDVYVCLSAQREAEEVTSKAGNTYLKAIRNQQNAVALKTLYLDIDVKGGGKGYDDQKTALVALLGFCADIDLPRPTMVVNSGGGLHVYFELDRSLDLTAWQPLAAALAEAARQRGLLIDAGVTIDSARILRPPQTKNFKTDPPKETRLIGSTVEGSYSVERLWRALEPYKVAVTPASNAPIVLGPISEKLKGIENTASAGISEKKPVNLDSAMSECGFLQDALGTGGAAFDQPLWNLTTLIATFGAGGREDAHRMAQGHPDYTPESTDELFDRKLRERDQKDLGWPSCGSILNAGCKHCATCPHLKAGKSPLNLTIAPPPAVVAGVILPKGYFFNAVGHVCGYREVEGGAKQAITLIEYPVSDAWAQKDPWVLHFSAILHDNLKSKIELTVEAMMSRDTLVKALGKQGCAISPTVGREITEFFVSWVKTLQALKDKVVDSSPFGWNTSKGEVDGFCFGGEVWTPTGSRPAPQVDHILRKQYAPTGDAAYWRDAINLVVGQGRPELEIMVASAFAAPLVKATGWYGAFVSAYSQESGIGKSTALKIAQAVWGNPVTAMQGMDDTLNSVTHKIGAIRSLPLYWDEIKGEENSRKFVKLAFQMTSGKDKSRLGRDASLREVGQWQTMLVSASNESLLEYVSIAGTTAGLYRLFEFPVSKPLHRNNFETPDAQRMLGRLDDNYGTIGFEYAKWLGQNFSRIYVEVGERMNELSKDWAFRQDERFWLCTVTCILMGARYSKELGFADFDIPAMETFLYGALQHMRAHLKDTHVDLTNPTNVCNIFTQFLKSMHRHTIITNRVPKTRGRPKPTEFKVLKIHPHMDGLQVHIGKEDQIIRISSNHFSEWISKNTQVSRNVLLTEFKRHFGAEKVVGRLGSGTDYVEGTENLIEIHAAGTPLAAFISEANVDDPGKPE